MANCFSYMSGGMKKSLEYYDWCLKLKEDYLEAHLDRVAVAKNMTGYTNNAIEKLKIAYSYHPDVVNVCQMLGSLYEDLYNNSLSNKERNEVLENLHYYKLG